MHLTFHAPNKYWPAKKLESLVSVLRDTINVKLILESDEALTLDDKKTIIERDASWEIAHFYHFDIEDLFQHLEDIEEILKEKRMNFRYRY